VLEFVYTALLVVVALFITWFSVYVVYKLYQGQK
jgi:cell division protein FtsL